MNPEADQEDELIPCQRSMFDIPDDVSYLNCAYYSPMLKKVAATGTDRLTQCTQPWRLLIPDHFQHAEQARVEFARLIDADADDIAVVTSVSFGIAVAARNLPLQAGQKIVVLQDQFPSNVYAWRELARQRGARIATVITSPAADLTGAVLEQLTDNTGIVALPQARWSDGAVLDLETIGRRCREIGASLVLDLTQTLGVMPFSTIAVQADFVTCAAYKWLLGPYGLAYLYARKDRQAGEPIEYSWLTRHGSENFANATQYQDSFRLGARRYDSGEPSHLTIPMSVAALRQVHRWSTPKICATIAAKTHQIEIQLEQLGLQPLPSAQRAPNILSVNIGKHDGESLSRRLASEKIFVSLRGQFLRISPHVYNDERDIERLTTALALGRKS